MSKITQFQATLAGHVAADWGSPWRVLAAAANRRESLCLMNWVGPGPGRRALLKNCRHCLARVVCSGGFPGVFGLGEQLINRQGGTPQPVTVFTHSPTPMAAQCCVESPRRPFFELYPFRLESGAPGLTRGRGEENAEKTALASLREKRSFQPFRNILVRRPATEVAYSSSHGRGLRVSSSEPRQFELHRHLAGLPVHLDHALTVRQGAELLAGGHFQEPADELQS